MKSKPKTNSPMRLTLAVCMIAGLSALSTSANALLITWDLTIGGGNIGTSTTTFEASGSTLTATGYSATTGTGLDADWSLNNLHLHDKGLAVRGGGNHGQVNVGEAILFDFGGPTWSLSQIDFRNLNASKDAYSLYYGDAIVADPGNSIFDGFDGLVELENTITADPYNTDTPLRYVLLVGEVHTVAEDSKFRVRSISGTAPEPATAAILGLGLVAAGAAARRRRAKAP